MSDSRRNGWIAGLVFVAAGLAVVVGTDATSALSHSRIAEAVVGVGLTSSLGIFGLRAFSRFARPVTPIVTQAAQASIAILTVVAVLAVGNLWLLLLQAHNAPDVEPIREFDIAACIVTLSLLPFFAWVARRRHIEAKALTSAAAPDRWQSYNDRLAR